MKDPSNIMLVPGASVSPRCPQQQPLVCESKFHPVVSQYSSQIYPSLLSMDKSARIDTREGIFAPAFCKLLASGARC